MTEKNNTKKPKSVSNDTIDNKPIVTENVKVKPNIKTCNIVAVGINTFSVYFDDYGIELDGKFNKNDIGTEVKVAYEGLIGKAGFKVINWKL